MQYKVTHLSSPLGKSLGYVKFFFEPRARHACNSGHQDRHRCKNKIHDLYKWCFELHPHNCFSWTVCIGTKITTNKFVYVLKSMSCKHVLDYIFWETLLTKYNTNKIVGNFSLYSWRFPLPYCSYKAAPAHPNSLNLPLPVKLAPSPM